VLKKNEIPTPALTLDLDCFEANLTRMAELARRSGKGLRPHAKAHKCTWIAERQIAAGAIGICVATLAEAELMAKAGIAGLLLTSPVADPVKMARIVRTGAMIVVDHPQQAAWYDEAASRADRRVDVLVDLDVGDHRTGARPGAQALEVVRAVDRAPHLRLRGLQAYSGRCSHTLGVEERRQVSEDVFRAVGETRDVMLRDGLCADILSGGSTGSAGVDVDVKELTELQAGSYVLMDMDYGRLGLDYHHALTVLATVVSASHEGFVTVDGGFKAFSTDRGYGPQAPGFPGSGFRFGGDEFGYLDVDACERKPRLGERIVFVPPHCDPTVNLYDRIHACRGDVVEAIWPVMDRMR
jgi:3-hydroxy-D-aspartate aldolase